MSNLVHLGFIGVSWLIVAIYLKSSGATRFRLALRLLQILPVLFAVDFVIGFTLIDRWYGPEASAGWISKSAFIYPAMFLAAIWQMFRSHRKNHSQTDKDMP
jgi:hypothetical protein